MFGFEYLKKLFTKKNILQEEYSQKETDEALDLKDPFLILGTEPLEDDYVVVPENASQRESQIDQSGVETELLAKIEVYNLSVTVAEDKDTALASEMRLQKQGIKVHQLGTDAAREKGIFLYALVNEKNPEAPITVVSRGTQFDASMIADLDPTAPGHAVLQQMRPEILSQLDTLCEKFPQRKIRVTGHSLGGAMSQILTSYLLEEKRSALEDSSSKYVSLAKIPGVDTIIFQSAGLSEQLIKTTEKDAECIKYLDPNFDINFTAHVKKGDFVSRTGQYLFSDIDSSVVDVTLVLRNLDKQCVTLGDCLSVGMTAGTTLSPAWTGLEAIKTIATRYVTNRLEAHTDFFYHDKEGECQLDKVYGMYRNANSEDRKKIEDVFKKQFALINNPISKKIQKSVFEQLENLSSAKLQAAIDVAAGAHAVVSVVASSKGAEKAVMSVVKHAGTIQKAANQLANPSADEKSGFFKVFVNGVKVAKDERPAEEKTRPNPPA